MALLPGLEPLAGDLPLTYEGKRLLDLSRTDALAQQLELRAIVLPHVAAATGAPVPVSPGEALAALAPTTLVQLPGSRAVDGAAMARLAATLPARRVAVGPGPDTVVAVLREILDEVAA